MKLLTLSAKAWVTHSEGVGQSYIVITSYGQRVPQDESDITLTNHSQNKDKKAMHQSIREHDVISNEQHLQEVKVAVGIIIIKTGDTMNMHDKRAF